MKKALVAAILGIALNVASSHGQGYIAFQSYDLVGQTPIFSGVTYGPGSGAKTGQYVGAASGFKADLLYSLTGAPGSFTLASGSQTSFYVNGGVQSSDGGSPTTDGAGIFIGPTLIIPGYTSGPVSFITEAYNGSSYGQQGFYNGQSAVYTISSLQTNPALPAGTTLNNTGTTVNGMQPFVVTVPEPSIFALAGLGAAGLMAFRRKK
ncbi:MAG TPA: PEP-CTERM sorting domain-containing protein [Verrucomicrobiae bacterium]|nr:PEP-CTERM sorting domain-containing protein [Verrucomicrobiae bacterium]